MNLKAKTTETAKLLQRIRANLHSLDELLKATDDEDVMYSVLSPEFQSVPV